MVINKNGVHYESYFRVALREKGQNLIYKEFDKFETAERFFNNLFDSCINWHEFNELDYNTTSILLVNTITYINDKTKSEVVEHVTIEDIELKDIEKYIRFGSDGGYYD